MKYWKTYNKDLILQFMQSAIELTPKALLWQQTSEDRTIFSIHFDEISKDLCLAQIEGLHEKVDASQPIYIKSQDDNIIFKKSHYNKVKDNLEFAMPGTIQILDKRKIERFYYLYQDHKTLRYKPANLDDTKDISLATLEAILVDLSINGAGIVLPLKQIENLAEGQGIILCSITDQTLPSPFRAEIIYISEYKTKDRNLFKVGLRFDEALDSITYKSISKIIEKKQIKQAGLSPNQFCGLSLDEQQKTLQSIDSGNQELAQNIRSNIEYLNRLKYMTSTMKADFLKQIDQELLATSLRITTKELIYELFSDVSSSMQKDFLDLLKEKKPASIICNFQNQLIEKVREMEKNGEIILNPVSSNTYI